VIPAIAPAGDDCDPSTDHWTRELAARNWIPFQLHIGRAMSRLAQRDLSGDAAGRSITNRQNLAVKIQGIPFE
jgi:hypothetical protein